MFGLGYRTTAYAFMVASGFFLIAGQPYYKFAFGSLVCALIFAFLKLHEESTNREIDRMETRMNGMSDQVDQQLEKMNRIANNVSDELNFRMNAICERMGNIERSKADRK